MDPAARNLYRATSPEYMEDGTPKVTIPSHVLLQETFDLLEISTIPVWVTLKNIPHRLYSIPGISHIASGLGAPMATYKPRLDPSLMGEAKILVEVELSKAFPPRIAAADKRGNISMVNVEYAWIPAVCGDCGQLGHKASRCLHPHLPNEKITQLVSKDVTAPTIVSISSLCALVSPITLPSEPPVAPITTTTKIQLDTALAVDASQIQVIEESTEVADCHTIVEAGIVTEAVYSVETVTEIAGSHEHALSEREVRHVMTNNRFNHLGSSFSDGESLESDGDSIESDDSDTESRILDQMTPAGQ
ncbi:PREDICTED: uncharacterized protein LOC104700716 isoform X3 [Camelina sativa]|uniref:Uncharacterized protein LOC104700716 isoform X3 n=1 Tax=Camelina sativa TaxID=90675 RepID=A0ABM1Q8M2_CAMSA|nr:PREDICTED: uncharacterized protein LOC104700716 isoform X3 [Camelina sativa]